MKLSVRAVSTLTACLFSFMQMLTLYALSITVLLQRQQSNKWPEDEAVRRKAPSD